MAVNKHVRAKFERTSFGTSQAQAARRSVTCPGPAQEMSPMQSTRYPTR